MNVLETKKVEAAPFPCQFGIEELKAEVEESLLQHKRGQTKTQEEVFDEIENLLAE